MVVLFFQNSPGLTVLVNLLLYVILFKASSSFRMQSGQASQPNKKNKAGLGISHAPIEQRICRAGQLLLNCSSQTSSIEHAHNKRLGKMRA